MQQQDNRWDGWVTLCAIFVAGGIFGTGIALQVEQTTIALVAGALTGAAIVAPCVAIIAWVVAHQGNAPQTPPAQAAPPQVVEQHLHIHLSPGETMDKGQRLALLTRQTGSIDKARALIESGRATVEGERESG